MPERFLLNGTASATIALGDRGLAYGDGLFETISVVEGRPRFLSNHLARLQRGCERLSITLDFLRLKAEIEQLLACDAAPRSVLKITVTRGGNQRGYRTGGGHTANRYLRLSELDPARLQRQQDGVRLALCRHRLPDNPRLAGIKHLNRLDNVLAASEWRSGRVDEGLMLDARGRVIEGTMSNLFLVSDNCLITPGLGRCGVEGVLREMILTRLAPALTIPARVQDVTLGQVQRAEELFICNSLIGICPVLALECQRKAPGPVTRQLQASLEALH